MHLKNMITEYVKDFKETGGYGIIEDYIGESGEVEDYITGEESYSVWDSILDAKPVIKDGEIIGAEILITFGGPNIWINTATEQIYGAWWLQWEVSNIDLFDDIPYYWQERAEASLDDYRLYADMDVSEAIEDGKAVKFERYETTV